MLPLAFSPHPYGCACFLWRIPVRTNLLSHISYFLIQRRCIKESSSFSNIRRFSQSFLSFPFLFKWQLCTLEFYCPNLGIKQLPNHAFFHWKFQLITTTFLHWKSLKFNHHGSVLKFNIQISIAKLLKSTLIFWIFGNQNLHYIVVVISWKNKI